MKANWLQLNTTRLKESTGWPWRSELEMCLLPSSDRQQDVSNAWLGWEKRRSFLLQCGQRWQQNLLQHFLEGLIHPHGFLFQLDGKPMWDVEKSIPHKIPWSTDAQTSNLPWSEGDTWTNTLSCQGISAFLCFLWKCQKQTLLIYYHHVREVQMSIKVQLMDWSVSTVCSIFTDRKVSCGFSLPHKTQEKKKKICCISCLLHTRPLWYPNSALELCISCTS